ncbi:hypothetical protein DCAR_0414491 [Daucus carota subsp. sativus]|uniref:Glabrous enhancer-binding protein-like DBD domain-containing protein n=1 Tax=Daucus carota subsp. sativus TaxID=79200 RepID=A0A175YC27_DAUCS|nr:hypothetical protein DCAR_0414491 [Daucus carota subsp. sativus]
MEVMKSAPIITKVFTQKDEIKLLKSMIRYKSEKSRDATSDLADFTDFVKPLSFPASKTQVGGKIQRLRTKFRNNFKREKHGKKPIGYFNKHQCQLYGLSKKIWATLVQVDSDDEEGVGNDN